MVKIDMVNVSDVSELTDENCKEISVRVKG